VVHLVARDGSAITDFDSLKGKKVSLPYRSREHCHLFVERHCEKLNCTAEKFFAKVVKHNNVEDALDDVVRGEVDAVVVDSLSLDCYGTVKPGCMPLLKTIEKSDLFPAGVVAYREGALSEETLNAFRTGMLNANKNAKSRGLMALFKLTAFEGIPEDYQEALTTIRKAYPAPSALVIKTTETTKPDSE
jgi:ABC-type phosphate/phosphonate transport system substrate-binding protein